MRFGFVAFALVWAASLHAQDLSRFQKFKAYLSTYKSELKEEGPVRLFLKKAEAPVEERWWGLWQKAPTDKNKWYHKPRNIIYAPGRKWSRSRFGEEFEFHPWSGSCSILFTKPLRAVTKKLGNEKNWTIPVRMAASIGGFLGFLAFLDETNKDKASSMKTKLEVQLINNSRSDFRFKDIYKLLDAGKIDQSQAEELAFAINEAYVLTFEYLKNGYQVDTKEQRRAFFLSNPIFSSIASHIDNPMPGDDPNFIYQSDSVFDSFYSFY